MIFDPLEKVLHVCVSARNVLKPAVQAPRHEPGENEAAVASRADQRRASVIGAGIDARLTTSAHEALVEAEARAQTEILELLFANQAIYDRNFCELEFIGGRRFVVRLAPACNCAISAGSDDLMLVWKADGSDVDFLCERVVPFKQSDVVEQASRVILRMRDDLRHLPVVMRCKLKRRAAVPLAGSDDEIGRICESAFQAVICCDRSCR